ncbi:MAG: hypothetical protein HY822_16110, partial [Acidobacteria bacterium]|nr:hypothetical protein [Acidobacteriota bacterium]
MKLLTGASFAVLFALTALANPLPTSVVVYDSGGYVSSTPGSAHGSNGDVLGALKDFDIDYIRFSINAAQEIEALI